MKLIPETSFQRTFYLIAMVIVVSQLVTLIFGAYYIYYPGMKQYSHIIAIEVDTLNAASADLGEQVANLIREKHGLEIIEETNDIPEYQRYSPTQVFANHLASEFGDHSKVRLRFFPAPELWISTPALNQKWMKIPMQNFGPNDVLFVVLWGIGVPILALFATMLSVRQISIPLKHLELAARRVGRGEFGVSLLDDARGAVEIRALNRAFNQMTLDMLQAQRDRALLLAGVSHDLRTPLTRMRLTAELLAAEDAELTEGMVKDIEDMDAILDQFISFIRDGSDEASELNDLNVVITEVIGQFESNGISIKASQSPLPFVSFKRLAIKRMLGNLVNNAIRHGRQPIEIVSGVENQEIRISVYDSGDGVNENEIKQLFQPFARGDEARGTLGSGLGLAIVRKIAEMHHGRVELKNRPQGGVEARVSLPIAGELVPPENISTGVR